MAYNYDETVILNEMFELYDKNEKTNSIMNIYNNLKEIVYNLIIYNDSDNIIGLINDYGGQYQIAMIYETKYKQTDLLDIDKNSQLSYNNLLAFVGVFDYIYTTVLGVIEEIDRETEMDDLCDLMSML